MKKVILGGLIFVGGTVLYSVGVLGIAAVDVQAHAMQLPQYLGMLFMAAGLVLGFLGLRENGGS